MRKIAPTVVCIVIVAVAAMQPFVRADWSMFRSDPSHSGVGTDNPKGNPWLTPTELWKTNLTWTLAETEIIGKKRSWTEPAVMDGVVYVGANYWVYVDRYRYLEWIEFYAFDAANGAEIWDYRDDSCYSVSSPAVVNGVVYFATDTYTCALSASDGSMLWKYGVGMCFSSPVVVQNRLFMGGGALNAKNGHSIWNCTVGAEEGLYCPAVANGMVYIGSTDWNIYALDASTGDEVWNYYAGDQLIVPMVAKGVVYAFLTGAICALDADSGAIIWNYSIPDLYWSPGEKANLAAENDIVYAASPPENLYALNAASGALVWNFTFSVQEISAPTVVNDVVYLGSTSGLYALNGTNGELLWNYTKADGFGSPVVVDSVAYAGDFYGGEDNQLHAIAVPSPPLTPFSVVPLAAAVAVVAVVAVCSSLLLYFKKRGKKAREEA